MFRQAITLFSFLLAFSTQAKVVIVSDLDETLRQANAEHYLNAATRLVTGVRPYTAIQIIFTELKAKNADASFYYLSNSYDFLYNGKKWARENGFPEGTVYQRKLGDKSESFKPGKLREIARQNPDADSWIFFGDNIEKDPQFYQGFIAEAGLSNARVFIRDARLIFPVDANTSYFQHEGQILEDLSISSTSSDIIRKLPFNHLVPPFLMKNLYKRILKECTLPRKECKDDAEETLADVRMKLEIN